MAPSYNGESPAMAPPQPAADLAALIAVALPFLRGGDSAQVDPELPALAAVLRDAGAGECWHKHGTFLAHLLDVHRILRLWGAPPAVARCGLYHSAYSNSYVNLAIFDAGTCRGKVEGIVGQEAERLVYLFCVVPRQQIIHDWLLFKYSDEEILEHLEISAASVKKAKDEGVFDDDEPWRKKLQSVLPADGITVKHIRSGEDIVVSRRIMATFLLMTMADFSDQLFDWQDKLFDNADGRLEFRGNAWTALWPGEGKPGLWVSSISRMGAIYTLITREEEIYIAKRKKCSGGADDVEAGRDEDIELVIPPVFSRCTEILKPDAQIAARDLYWEAVCGGDAGTKAEKLLEECIGRNPFVGEPHIVLAQVHLNAREYEAAERAAEQGLRLLLEWGSSWDKRMTWEGWISWGRVLWGRAREKAWPDTSFGILNLGLVR